MNGLNLIQIVDQVFSYSGKKIFLKLTEETCTPAPHYAWI